MPGVHDFTNYLKRGYGRATFHASVDVRAGLLSREEGFELARQYDSERPEALDYYLKITGLSEEEFFAIMKEKRVGPAKDIDLPVLPKRNNATAEVVPHAVRIISSKRASEHH
jgi:hypothetical protein